MKYPGGPMKNSACHFIENSRNAAVAQSVERVLGKDEVGSSILLVSSIYRNRHSSLEWRFSFWPGSPLETRSDSPRHDFAPTVFDCNRTTFHYPQDMFKTEKWRFDGASGAQHTFSISPKSHEFPALPGVLILAYTHPRGHRAGWQVNVLHVGYGDNLRTIATPLDQECLHENSWNCKYFLVEPNEHARRQIFLDLIQTYDPPCCNQKERRNADATRSEMG
jgi:hypothetical protein